MAYQPVPDLPDDTAENVPRVMGVRDDDSLALAPAGLPLTGGTVTGDLTVNGNSDLKINVPADYWSYESGTVFTGLGMCGGTQGAYSVSMTSNGYRNTDGTWTSMGAGGQPGAVQISLLPTGVFEVRTKGNYPNGSASNPPLRCSIDDVKTKITGNLVVDGSINGSLLFGIVNVGDTAEVLDRAETATMPGDADGDPEAESITVNEIVTALMAKVKELSARIETLEQQ